MSSISSKEVISDLSFYFSVLGTPEEIMWQWYPVYQQRVQGIC